MDFQSTFKKVLLAGVGAASLGAEKGKELVDILAEKGAISVEEGKRINEELKKKLAEKKEERINDYVKGLSKEDREKLKKVLSDAEEAEEAECAEACDEEADDAAEAGEVTEEAEPADETANDAEPEA